MILIYHKILIKNIEGLMENLVKRKFFLKVTLLQIKLCLIFLIIVYNRINLP
jgi:hypothetical protein